MTATTVLRADVATGRRWNAPDAGDVAGSFERLIEAQFSTGPDAVLKAVYDRYGRLVFSYCARRLGDDAGADATQEVFISAWRSRASYDARKAPLGAWLLGIARFKVIDALRRQTRQPLAFDGASPVDVASGELAVDEELAGRLLVVDALADLDERPRRVLRMTFFDGRTNDEVAEHLQMPIGTVKSDIRRGLQRLRERMGVHDEPA